MCDKSQPIKPELKSLHFQVNFNCPNEACNFSFEDDWHLDGILEQINNKGILIADCPECHETFEIDFSFL
ncbi:MAG: hypothetical protein KJ915_11860, partial [Candidatus Omnitrophica bacterium]|nr:hypothetical protein [Candidatus Omnitrophota bacterium]